LETRIARQRRLEGIEQMRILQTHRDGIAALAAPICRCDRIAIAPELRVVLVGGIELAHDGPRLSAEVDLGAELRVLELAHRPLADDELPQAGREAPAGEEAHVGAQGPGALTEAPHLDVGVEPAA